VGIISWKLSFPLTATNSAGVTAHQLQPLILDCQIDSFLETHAESIYFQAAAISCHG